MNRILSKAIASAFILLLSGCGGSKDQELTDVSQDVEEYGLKLEYWDVCSGSSDIYENAMTELADAYMNFSGVKIDVTLLKPSDYYTEFLSAAASDSSPDACSSAMPQPIQYASIKQTLDLSGIIQAWRLENSSMLDDIGAENLALFNIDGEQTGIPYSSLSNAIYYRKDLFEEAGITTAPRTMIEFERALYLFKSRFPEKTPFLISALGDSESTKVSTFFIDSNGGTKLNNLTQLNFTSPNNVEAFAYLAR
ncbi:MAG: extracellular solute-binding protein [Clostridiales bacterium]|nr:extracellular solute-binding protein [Clostridiales bacterium]